MNELLITTNSFLAQHPEVDAILVALAGLVIARLCAWLAGAGLAGLERLTLWAAPDWLAPGALLRFQPFLRGLVFYSLIFFFLLWALDTLNISILEAWVAQTSVYVSRVFLAILILLAGYLAGLLAQAALASALPSGSSQFLPRMAQLLILGVAALTALSQLAIDVAFLTWVIVILLGSFLGGLSLAFALGSGQLVSNILARREVSRYKIGNRVRIGELEGVIVDVLDTAVLLESPEGTTAIPYARFAAEPVTLLSGGAGQGPTQGQGQRNAG